MSGERHTFYEFFAGGGMARAGLGDGWQCLFANDFNPMKAAAYADNWGADHFVCGDIAAVKTSDLPGRADLAWASFPCQDLSLAGARSGMDGATRSGTFWAFWGLMKQLKREGRAPRMIVLENVLGTLTSRRGEDFAAICAALVGGGYRFGALVVDAKLFVPQSRQRVFFIAIEGGAAPPSGLCASGSASPWHPKTLVAAQARLPANAQDSWIWWNPATPTPRSRILGDLVEDNPADVEWHSPVVTATILAMMSERNAAKVQAALASGKKCVGAIYKRIRIEAGAKIQRAEVRFDGVSGCLRTPRGGSSRQTILVVEGDEVRSRLLSSREAARLMGLPESYKLPARYNDAYHLAGDGVCVPVVAHLARHILKPCLTESAAKFDQNLVRRKR